jgi:hypothetical protein
MAEDFSSHRSGLTAPAREAFAITPSDTADLAQPSRAIYIGGSGTLRVRMLSGDVVDFSGLLGGAIYPFRVAQIMQSGTSATGLVALR